MKTTVRWRHIPEPGAVGWTVWTVNGRRIIVDDPKRAGKRKPKPLEDRVLRVIKQSL